MRILNPLLYLTSAALLGSAGLSFYEALPADGAIQGGGPNLRKLQEKAMKDAGKLLKKGRATKAPQTSWNYSNGKWWSNFIEANLVGKKPPAPPPPDGPNPGKTKVEKAPPQKPLEEIIQVVAILYESRSDGVGGDNIEPGLDTSAGAEEPATTGGEPKGAPSASGNAAVAVPDTNESQTSESQTVAAGAEPEKKAKDPLARPEVGNHTQVMVVYTPESGVQLPTPAQPVAAPPTRTNTARGASNRGNSRRNNGRGFNNRPSSIVPGGQSKQIHTLSVGDTLYPPFEHIRLARVAPDAKSAFFVRTVPAEEGEGTKEQEPEELFKGERGLGGISQDVLRILVERQRAASGQPKRSGFRDVEPVARVSSGRNWFDVEETQQVEPGTWNVSREDSSTLSRDPNTLLSQVGLRPYKSNNLRGVQVDNVSPEISSRFGVNSGDVILSVNGEQVTSRSNAINVGRKQHDRGVRVFDVQVLTSTGRTETRSYRVQPD